MSKLIAVDAGHGLHTAGKRTPDGEREWSFNNRVVIALIDELHRLGLRTVRLDDPSGQRDVPLGERTRKANNAKADVLVSVHHNALTGRWGDHTGSEIYSYPNAKSSADLAKKLQPILSNAYGLRNRGAKTANFHMLRESNMPAILTEGGYMDSRIDIVKMRDEEVLKQAGITIARNVAEWLGIEVNVKSGWIKNNTGWWYKNKDGSYPKNQWKKISNVWYLFDKKGYMLKGWQKVKGTWYRMDKSGAMITGWTKSNGRWFYLNKSGAMLTGLQVIGKNAFYLDPADGAMLENDKKCIPVIANKHGHLK